MLGSLNVDLALASERLPREGETLLVSGQAPQPGGKGGNQAVQAARLGAAVEMIGRVGDDAFGLQLLDALAVDGVGTSLVGVAADRPTGMAVVVSLPSGGNSILVSPGANHAWTLSDVDAAEATIAGASMLLLQLEVPVAVVQRAVKIAGSNRVPVLLNPAPAADVPPGLLSGCDYLVPNQHEAAALTGIVVDGLESAAAAARALQARGAGVVVVTAGALGAVVAGPGEDPVAVPGRQVSAVDSTAAGDSFCGALAVALCGGASPREAATFACEVAALTVTRRGSQGSLPRRDQLAAPAGTA